MKESKECKIIQDLLPNYIEKLTNKETNSYIEEHLEICVNCKNMYEKMKNEIQLENKKTGKKLDKREVNFFKRYKNKLRVLRIIILIIILAFAISAVRKMYIVGDLYNKAEQIVKNTNYHREITSMSKGNFTKTEIWATEIILIIILAFAISAVRKMYIVGDLYNKAEQIVKNTNYHREITSMSKGNFTKTEIWATENKIKMILKKFENDKIEIREIYGTKKGRMENSTFDSYIANEYTTINGEKTAKLNKEIQIGVEPQTPFYVENKFQLFLYAILSSVKSTTFYGKECYYITNYKEPFSINEAGMYLDKETGLPISYAGYETEFTDSGLGRIPAAEYKYEFNTVTEDNFVEPDLSEYKVEK